MNECAWKYPLPGHTAWRCRMGLSASRSERVVAVEDAPEPAEHRAFAAILSAALGRRREHAAGHARERQGLQPDLARTGQRGEEHAFAAEQHALDATDRAHVHRHGVVEGHHAAGID